MPGDRVVDVLVLQRLPESLPDLGGSERACRQDGALGRHVGGHDAKRPHSEHQRRHPPGVVRADDPGAGEPLPLQLPNGLQQVGDLPLLLLHRPVRPYVGRRIDGAAGERRQGGVRVVLHVEPLIMPPLVGHRGLHRHVLLGASMTEMNPGAPNRHRRRPLLAPGLPRLLIQAHREEILSQLEVGLNPQESLTQRDECRDVLDPIGVEVLELEPVVVKKPAEEAAWRGGESPLVEVGEGDDVAGGRRRNLLRPRQQPLVRRRLLAKEPLPHQALGAVGSEVGDSPGSHRQEREWIDGGRDESTRLEATGTRRARQAQVN
ncbi:hypothetical protein SEVIR_8G238775v4 [Setaria viridis]